MSNQKENYWITIFERQAMKSKYQTHANL